MPSQLRLQHLNHHLPTLPQLSRSYIRHRPLIQRVLSVSLAIYAVGSAASGIVGGKGSRQGQGQGQGQGQPPVIQNDKDKVDRKTGRKKGPRVQVSLGCGTE